jgi:Zn ribbon nucleic-acid-binding protein
MPTNDPIKQREASRRHYEKHRDRVIASAKKYSKLTRDRIRAYISNYLKTNPCVDCGEANIIVLEFDHIGDDKDFNLSDAARKGVSMKKLNAEIAKCEVRCANCHRRKTYQRSGLTHRD